MVHQFGLGLGTNIWLNPPANSTGDDKEASKNESAGLRQPLARAFQKMGDDKIKSPGQPGPGLRGNRRRRLDLGRLRHPTRTDPSRESSSRRNIFQVGDIAEGRRVGPTRNHFQVPEVHPAPIDRGTFHARRALRRQRTPLHHSRGPLPMGHHIPRRTDRIVTRLIPDRTRGFERRYSRTCQASCVGPVSRAPSSPPMR
jgi:hypothetical protein